MPYTERIVGSKARNGFFCYGRSSTSLIAMTALIVTVGAFGPANAETASTPANPAAPAGLKHASGGLEQIVVTAEKRASTVQKTPIAITAIGQKALQQRHVIDVQDLNDLVPGVQFYPITNVVQVSIRGLGSTFFDPRADSAVSSSIDGLYFARPIPNGGLFYDLARIEVLKGPQGTLYGRNAGVGAVNLITNRPTNTWEAAASVSVGDYGTVDSTWMVNIPISDTFQIRGAVQTANHDGYVGGYYNDADAFSGRTSFVWKPTDELTIFGEANYSREAGHGYIPTPYPCPGSTPYSLYVPVSCAELGLPGGRSIPKTGHINDQLGTYQLHGDYDFGWATLTSISGLVSVRDNDEQNPNGLVFSSVGKNHTVDYSQELRLAGTDSAHHANGIQWVVGAYGLYGEGQYFFSALGPPTYFPAFDQHSEAVFTQVSYGITGTTRVTAGGRYSIDQKRLDDSHGDSLLQGSHIFTYKVGVEQDLTPRNLIYADISTGYVAGGASGGSPSLPSAPYFAAPIFNPERNTAYEIGSKNRFFGSRVQLNGDAYYYKFSNYQIYQPSFLNNNPAPIGNIQNIGNVTTYGAEADLSVQLTPSDQFTASLSYAHGTYGALSFASFYGAPPNFVPEVTTAPSGDPLVNLPEWQSLLGYTHIFELPNNSSLVAEADATISDKFALIPGSKAPTDFQSAFAKGDISLTYNPPSRRWSLEGWVKNVSNVPVVDYGEGVGITLYSLLPPRTYGFTLAAHF